MDLNKLIEDNRENLKKVKIVANLPYYITTPIIMELLEKRINIDSITVMIQKEVADRLTAIPGEKDTGAITYCVYYYSEPEKILNVSNQSFVPEPKVESEVIKLNIRNTPIVEVKDEIIEYTKDAIDIIGDVGSDLLDSGKEYIKKWYENFRN